MKHAFLEHDLYNNRERRNQFIRGFAGALFVVATVGGALALAAFYLP